MNKVILLCGIILLTINNTFGQDIPIPVKEKVNYSSILTFGTGLSWGFAVISIRLALPSFYKA
jgi:hypothetical protein